MVAAPAPTQVATPAQAKEAEYLDRPPRIQPPLPIEQFEIPPPPNKDQRQSQSLIELMLPLVTIVGYVVVAMSGSGRNLGLMIPMAMTMVISVSMAIWRNRNAGKDIAIKAAAYDQRLADMRHEMHTYHQLQRDHFYYNYPDLNDAISIAKTEEHSRSGPRVWERRTSDPDFGVVRLGIGTRPSTVVYTIKQGENAEDPQFDEAMRLAEASHFVTDIPVTLALYDSNIDPDKASSARNTLGIYALSPIALNGTGHKAAIEKTYGYIRSLLVHFTTFHSPADTRLYVVGTRQASEDRRWTWAEELPHCRAGKNEVRMCFEGEQTKLRDKYVERLPLFWKNLRSELQGRQQRLADKDTAGAGAKLPFMVIVVDMLEMDDASSLKNVESEQSISMIMHQGKQLGAAVIFLTDIPDKIPTDCQAIVELEPNDGDKVTFRYAEVGINTPRLVGRADMVTTQNLNDFAITLRDHKIRLSAATSLITALDLLQLQGVNSIDEIDILKNWKRSREAAEWCRVEIGMRGANEKSELIFSADEAGVHGAVAGTTGSGKSELLLTLIVGLSVTYDPSVVNFVLVDFKGGAAFKEFETLPHCVDIVTNLDESGVERMFSAIKAELDRRGKIIADNKVKHIVEYRKKGYHLSKEEGKGPFPNLFIIIDEFAEMVANKPEFKGQLESITRLGRAIGVSLILATQRPAGAITDQMRANMKFRICLRVETPDDSREVLGRSDAAYLPPSIPGRAYVQIGNEPPQIVQVARAGAPYRRGVQKAEAPRVRWLKRETKAEEETEDTISTALVKVMDGHRKDQGLPGQKKPWPNPLPRYMPLDWKMPIEHMTKEDRIMLNGGVEPAESAWLPLNGRLGDWMDGKADWRTFDWSHDRPMSTNVGLMDHPRAAVQLVLNINFTEGHVAIYGGPGWGKTNFLRTLIMGLASNHSPDDLHIYIMDFGGRQLQIFKELPHVGDVVLQDDDERIKRLLRILSDEVVRRKQKIAGKADDVIKYNATVATEDSDKIPAILVVIDNYAVIRENYEDLELTIISLLRDGRNAGVYFVATGTSGNSIPNKVFQLFEKKFSLRLTDSSEYSSILGRGSIIPGEIPGRGLAMVERKISQTPLEIQIAAPVGLAPDKLVYDEADLTTEEDDVRGRFNEQASAERLMEQMTPRLVELIDKMKEKWEGRTRPNPILKLPEYIYFRSSEFMNKELEPNSYRPDSTYAIIGVEDRYLKAATIELGREPHFIVTGPPTSGKTNLLQTWILSLANRYTPQQVAMVLMDPQDRLADYSGKFSLAQLPHVIASVNEEEQFNIVLKRLMFEYDSERNEERFPRPRLFVFVDNYDDIGELLGEKSKDKQLEELGKFAGSKYYKLKLHFIICGSEDISRGSDGLKRRVTRARFGFAMSVNSLENMGGKVTSAMRSMTIPVGRGFRVQAGKPTLLQVANLEPPEDESDDKATLLDKDINRLRVLYQNRSYRWYYDVAKSGVESGDAELQAALEKFEAGKAQPAATDDKSKAPQEADNLKSRADTEVEVEESVAELLTPGNMTLLPVDLLDKLNIEFRKDYSPEKLKAMSEKEIQAAINHGHIVLPAYLDTDVELRVRNALIALANSRVSTLLNGNSLKKLPTEIVGALGINFRESGVNLENLYKSVTNERFLQQQIESGAITLPSAIKPELEQQIATILGNRNNPQYGRVYKATNLMKLPLDVLQGLNIDFGGFATPENLSEKDPVEVQRLIDFGVIRLPEAQETPQLERAQVIVRNKNSPLYDELKTLNWCAMPMELITDLKIDFSRSGIDPKDLPSVDPMRVIQMLDDGGIILPGNTTQALLDQVKALPKL
ncbi:MAG: hypothetical protein MUF87_04930 [Anaerolineae bacterium]|nr:hypothetical protein [Anaerolineae bacterium]